MSPARFKTAIFRPTVLTDDREPGGDQHADGREAANQAPGRSALFLDRTMIEHRLLLSSRKMDVLSLEIMNASLSIE